MRKPMNENKQFSKAKQEWVHTLCKWWMSKSTTVNKNGFTPSANGECQSRLLSTSMGSHPLLMVDVKVYSKRKYIATFVESICIHEFSECIPENVSII